MSYEILFFFSQGLFFLSSVLWRWWSFIYELGEWDDEIDDIP